MSRLARGAARSPRPTYDLLSLALGAAVVACSAGVLSGDAVLLAGARGRCAPGQFMTIGGELTTCVPADTYGLWPGLDKGDRPGEVRFLTEELQAEGRLHGGQRAGRWTEYHRNKVKAAEGSYDVSGRLGGYWMHGPWMRWHDNGQLRSDVTYSHHGDGLPLPRVPWHEWWPNGNLRAECKDYDECTQWSEDGTKTKEEHHGAVTVYWPNASVRLRGRYVFSGNMRYRVDEWETFDPAGDWRAKVRFDWGGKVASGKLRVQKGCIVEERVYPSVVEPSARPDLPSWWGTSPEKEWRERPEPFLNAIEEDEGPPIGPEKVELAGVAVAHPLPAK